MRQAAQLRQVADELEAFSDYIEPDQHLSVSVADGRVHDVDIHGTQPEMLESIERNFDTATVSEDLDGITTVSEDLDGITRYVTVKTDTLEVTWHRR